MYYNYHMNEYPYGEFQNEYQSFEHEGSFGYGGRSLEHHLYSSLMTQGRYAELDKAKHNEQYRNYLLENFEGDEY